MKSENNLTVGRSIHYGRMDYEIIKIAKGIVYIKNECHTLKINWLRACHWIEKGIITINK